MAARKGTLSKVDQIVAVKAVKWLARQIMANNANKKAKQAGVEAQKRARSAAKPAAQKAPEKTPQPGNPPKVAETTAYDYEIVPATTTASGPVAERRPRPTADEPIAEPKSDEIVPDEDEVRLVTAAAKAAGLKLDNPKVQASIKRAGIEAALRKAANKKPDSSVEP